MPNFATILDDILNARDMPGLPRCQTLDLNTTVKDEHLIYNNKSTARMGNKRSFTILQGYPIYIAGQRHTICGLLQTLDCYVDIVSSHSVKTGGLKKHNHREVPQTLRKGEHFFVGDRLSEHHTHRYKVSSRYSIRVPTYGTYNISQKCHQREVTQKLRKGE